MLVYEKSYDIHGIVLWLHSAGGLHHQKACAPKAVILQWFHALYVL